MKEHSYISALASDDFGRMSALTTRTANAWAAKKFDTASQSLQMRTEQEAERKDARAYQLAENGLRIEFRDSHRAGRTLRRLIRTKVRPETKVRHTPPKERHREWIYASRALPKYSGPVIDRRGERGVFVRMRYYSRNTAEQGVSMRVVKYAFNGCDLDANRIPYFASNVATTIDEAICAFDHLEQINWSAQKNAKLLMHAITAVDHRQTPDEMMRTGLLWAEEAVGKFGLPYVVTLHAPPPDGDQRNWHLHILFSFRPMERVGDHEWSVGEALRTDLDNPAAMKLMREMYAAVMTKTSFESGFGQVYTAKSNAARGLVHEPQQHLGGALTSMAREGQFVAKNEENFEKVMRSEAAALDEQLRHMQEKIDLEIAEGHSKKGRFARIRATPALPAPVAAAALVRTEMSYPEVKRLPISPAMISSLVPPEVPARIAASIPDLAPIAVQALAPTSQSVRMNGSRLAQDGLFMPIPSAQASKIDIANLRFPLARPAPHPEQPAPFAIPRSAATVPRFIIPEKAYLGRALPVASVTSRQFAIPVRSRAATFEFATAPAKLLPPLAHDAAEPRSVPIRLPQTARIAGVPTQQPLLQMAQHVTSTGIELTLQRVTAAFAEVDQRDRRERELAEHRERQEKERADREAREAESRQIARERVAIQRAKAEKDRRARLKVEEEKARALEVSEARAQEERVVAFVAAVEARTLWLLHREDKYGADAADLARFDITADDLANEQVQSRLSDLHQRNHKEIAELLAAVKQYPQSLHEDRGVWSISANGLPDTVASVYRSWTGFPRVGELLVATAEATSFWKSRRVVAPTSEAIEQLRRSPPPDLGNRGLGG